MACRHWSHSHLCAHSVIDTRRPNRPGWGSEAGTVPRTVLAALDWLLAVLRGVDWTHPGSTTRQACQIKMRMIDLARESGATRNSLQGGGTAVCRARRQGRAGALQKKPPLALYQNQGHAILLPILSPQPSILTNILASFESDTNPEDGDIIKIKHI
jgi:hypothetical protein